MKKAKLVYQNCLIVSRIHKSEFQAQQFIFQGDQTAFQNPLKIQLLHNKYLHEQIFILCIDTKEVPRIVKNNRIKIFSLGEGIFQINVNYGFKEIPNIKNIMLNLKKFNFYISNDISYFVSRGIAVPSTNRILRGWVEHLFVFLLNNSASPTEYFKIPHEQVIEIGVHFKI